MGDIADYYLEMCYPPEDDEWLPRVPVRPRRYRVAPRCKFHPERMVLRRNRRTREYFWGCTNFPKCRETKQAIQPKDTL
jgi:hypothetical protein